jgi:phage terminase large subunit-like protein
MLGGRVSGMTSVADRLATAPPELAREAQRIVENLSRLSPESRKVLLGRLRANLARVDATQRFARMYPPTGALSRERYARHLAFFEASSKYTEICCLGANRSGKTTSAAYMLTAFLTGKYANWWPGRRFDGPVNAWACGTDAKTIRETIQAILLGPEGAPGTGLIPRDAILGTSAKSGVPGAVDAVSVRHSSGGTSRLLFKAYDQRREAFASAKCDVVWLDEECDEGIYSECLARITATSLDTRAGLLMCTYTPLLGVTAVTLRFLPGGRPKESV